MARYLGSIGTLFLIVSGLVLPAGWNYFNGKSVEVVTMRIAYGYKDARPDRLVGDTLERMTLIRSLTRDCGLKGVQIGSPVICGFHRDDQDSDRFSRTYLRSDGSKVNLVLLVTGSSAGLDDEKNRDNPFQLWKSQQAQKNLSDGISKGESTFYIGHSRDGGGPDFDPPHLNPTGHVDYPWYRSNRPGIEHLKQALKLQSVGEGSGQASIGRFRLELISCSSTELFEKELKFASSKLELRTVSGLIYYEDAARLALSDLNAQIEKNIRLPGPTR